MRITWVTRSFLDYRIPIYQEIDILSGHNLTLIYNGEVVPNRCTQRMKEILGDRCIPMEGEMRLMGKKKNPVSNSKGKGVRIPIQKGLISAIKKSKPDVILTDGFFQWTYAPLLMKIFGSKWKHVMCYEGWSHTERNMQGFRIKYRKMAMRWMDRICCNGTLCYNYVKSLGYPEQKLSLGNMAADTAFFSNAYKEITTRQKEEHRKNEGIMGLSYIFSGRLVQLKGVMEMLKAWKVFSADKDVYLSLIGDGSEKESLQKYIVDNKIRNVIFKGFVEYRNLPIYYSSADCFIIPTLQDNWSLVVPEAMSCGLPVLSSIYNGCYPELVTEKNGWTFDPLNTASLIEALEKSYVAREKLSEMGKMSSTIASRFTPELVAKSIYTACQNVL